MIRWCSYCSSFLGQTEPFNDFRVSHGVCDQCLDEGRFAELEPGKGQPVGKFFNDLFNSILRGEQIESDYITAQGRAIGLENSSLLLGVLHPILWKIGQSFENGEMSVENEHLFSQTIQSIIADLDRHELKKEIDVLFIRVPGNRHTFGVKFFSNLIYEKQGISSYEIDAYPSDSSALESLLAVHKPRLLGFSLALPEHFLYVKNILSDLDKINSPLKVIFGGAASKSIADEVKHLPSHMADRIFHVSDPFDTSGDLEKVGTYIRNIGSQR